jgi:hypothetical protein
MVISLPIHASFLVWDAMNGIRIYANLGFRSALFNEVCCHTHSLSVSVSVACCG